MMHCTKYSPGFRGSGRAQNNRNLKQPTGKMLSYVQREPLYYDRIKSITRTWCNRMDFAYLDTLLLYRFRKARRSEDIKFRPHHAFRSPGSYKIDTARSLCQVDSATRLLLLFMSFHASVLYTSRSISCLPGALVWVLGTGITCARYLVIQAREGD